MKWLGLAYDLRTPTEAVRNGDHPGYQRRLRRIQQQLINFRESMAARIAEFNGSDATSSLPPIERLKDLQQAIADRIDLFSESVPDLLLQGPEHVHLAYDELARDLVDICNNEGDHDISQSIGRAVSELCDPCPLDAAIASRATAVSTT